MWQAIHSKSIIYNEFSLAQQNGALEISLITAKEANALEPDPRVAAVIWSKTTGVVDSHVYMLSLLGGFEDAGGMVAYLCL